MSRTCHDVFSPKIDSPPRVLLFPSVSARVIVVKGGVVFVDSSAAEPIMSCTWLLCSLMVSKIWKWNNHKDLSVVCNRLALVYSYNLPQNNQNSNNQFPSFYVVSNIDVKSCTRPCTIIRHRLIERWKHLAAHESNLSFTCLRSLFYKILYCTSPKKASRVFHLVRRTATSGWFWLTTNQKINHISYINKSDCVEGPKKKAKQNKKIKWSRCLILLRRIFRLVVVLFGKLGGYLNDCPLTEN